MADIPLSDPIVVVNPPAAAPVVVIEPPPGAPGPQGPQGPQGLPGEAGQQTFTYQLAGVSSWNQAHVFAYLPEVLLVDENGDEVEAAVDYPDASHVFIEFPVPFTGTIVLS